MSDSSVTVSTDHASRYLQQLCRHFGRRVPVEFTPEAGRVDFPFGTCTLRAEDERLVLTVAGEPASLDRLEQVVGSHLARFAFREHITVTWRRTD